MLDVSEVRAIAEQFIQQEMKERYCSAKDESVEVESVEIDIKRIQSQRLSYLVQAIATERVARWLTITPKGFINRLLRRREYKVKGRSIIGNIVRFQLRVDASNGKLAAIDVAQGKGGLIDPFFDMRRI